MTIAISNPRRVGRRQRGPAPRPAGERARLLWLLGVLLAGFIVLVWQLTHLQVLEPERYLEHGASQRTFSQSLAADRGVIYDRNGVELAMSKPASSVFVDPELIDDPVASARAVAPILGLDPLDVEAKMRGEGRFAYLARKVDDATAEKITVLGLPGVALLEESVRHHPSGDLARSIIGSVDVDNSGLSGIEQLYGETLTGTPGQLVFERNPSGRTIPVGEHQMVPAVKGQDIMLTLDRALQFETERLLSDQVAKSKANGGIALVTRPSTGEILAMANVVADPESGAVVPGTNNAALTTAYEPGSVMKMVTISAAIEAGVVTPDTVFDVPSTLQIADGTFGDDHPIGGEADIRTILAKSSNVGTIKTAQKLGRQGLYDALVGFGFGQSTSIGFPNEQTGHVPAPTDWWDTSMGTIPIGQGVSVTPMQMLLAYNVIANGGVYVQPNIVRATIDPNGVEHPIPTDTGRRVVSQATSDQLNVMLRDVITDGTGEEASVHGYTPAGKTGTSRKPVNGSYQDEDGNYRYQGTFVGFVPAEQPALSIIVVIDEPKSGSYFGGDIAAPVFSKIASFALRHFGIAPPLTDAPAGGTPAATAAAGGAAPRSGDGKLRGMPVDVVPPPPPGATTTTTVGSDEDDAAHEATEP
jgi:cell division protein FtsI (penicillin-binding protein 3)